MMRRPTPLLVASLVILAACSGSDMQTTPQSQACEDYLRCVEATGEEPVDSNIDTFYADGICWRGEDSLARSCTEECRARLVDKNLNHPNTPECRLCETDADCITVERPACARTSPYQCVECTADSHCQQAGLGPICDTDRHRCGDCTDETDCPQERPFCVAPGYCRECEFDEDCPAELPICGADGECVECRQSRQDCPVGTCDTNQRCVAGCGERLLCLIDGELSEEECLAETCEEIESAMSCIVDRCPACADDWSSEACRECTPLPGEEACEDQLLACIAAGSCEDDGA